MRPALVEREGRVAQAEVPQQRVASGEVAGGHGDAAAVGQGVGVHAQDLAAPRRERLRRVGRDVVVAERDVEVAVVAEGHRAPRRARVELERGEERAHLGRVGDVEVRRAVVLRDARGAVELVVEDEEAAGRGVGRVKREPEQAQRVASDVDLRRQIEERGRQQPAASDDADRAAALDDVEVGAAGRADALHRRGEPGRHERELDRPGPGRGRRLLDREVGRGVERRVVRRVGGVRGVGDARVSGVVRVGGGVGLARVGGVGDAHVRRCVDPRVAPGAAGRDTAVVRCCPGGSAGASCGVDRPVARRAGAREQEESGPRGRAGEGA